MELMDTDIGETVSRPSLIASPSPSPSSPSSGGGRGRSRSPGAAYSSGATVQMRSDDPQDVQQRPAKRQRTSSKGRALSSHPPRDPSPLFRSSTALHILQGSGRKSPLNSHLSSMAHPLHQPLNAFTLPAAALATSHSHSSSSSSLSKPVPLLKGFRAPPRNKLEVERMNLPIYAHKDEIIRTVQNNDNIILVGETGSGKTTQIPQYLLSSGLVGRGQVGCTQPRRVAAVSVATRVAQEYGCALGGAVGYSIRFDDKTSPQTRIKYITDGMLLREIIMDPFLSRYNCLVLDEAHERTCNTDILFALLKQIQKKRKKILQMRKEKLQQLKRSHSPVSGRKSPSSRTPNGSHTSTPTHSSKQQQQQSESNSIGSPSPGMRPLDLETDTISAALSKADRKELKKKRKREQKERKLKAAQDAAAKDEGENDETDKQAVTHQDDSTSLVVALPPTESASFSLDDETIPPLDQIPNLSDMGELKLIIMSATLVAEEFQDYFDNAPILNIKGRTFPVEILHSEEPQVDYLDACLITILQIHLDWQNSYPNGDILVFLSGSEEIESAKRSLEEKVKLIAEEDCPIQMLVLPLYANLPPEQQMAVFEPAPANTRKVILSTNIAETSLTISGIRYVVDSGVTKLRWFNPKTGMEMLKVVDVSQAESKQRSGRAGRDAPGITYRLYTEDSYSKMKTSLLPEILRCNLASIVLQLKSLHVKNILLFDFMTKPTREALTKALEELYVLKALNYNGELSTMGRLMVHFPLPPPWAKMLLKSCENQFECSVEVCKILSVMSVEGIFYFAGGKTQSAEAKISAAQRKQFAHSEGDHFTYLDAFNSYLAQEGILLKKKETATALNNNTSHSSSSSNNLSHASQRSLVEWCRNHSLNFKNLQKCKKIYDQLSSLLKRLGLPLLSINQKEVGNEFATCAATDPIKKCLLFGLFHNVARKQAHDTSYLTLQGSQTVYIHPSSVLISRSKDNRPEIVAFNTLVQTSRNYMRECLVLPDLKWLVELVPEAYGNIGSSSTGSNGTDSNAALSIKGGKQALELHERLAVTNSNQSKFSNGGASASATTPASTPLKQSKDKQQQHATPQSAKSASKHAPQSTSQQTSNAKHAPPHSANKSHPSTPASNKVKTPQVSQTEHKKPKSSHPAPASASTPAASAPLFSKKDKKEKKLSLPQKEKKPKGPQTKADNLFDFVSNL